MDKMSHHPPRRLGRAIISSAAALSLITTGVTSAAAAPTATSAEAATGKLPSATHPALTQRVTLLTGDRVVLAGGDPNRVTVQPGPGRKHLAFFTQRSGDHFYVVPSDVNRDVLTGALDRRLFDVTGLIAAGYDDRHSSTIPLIVRSGDGQAPKALPNTTVTRKLPAYNATAMKLRKAEAGATLRHWTASRRPSGARIWLDGKRTLTLDVSVPQIGAPAAWEAGYTGRGIKVAVLDSGIDTSHPDLATRVKGERNFTTEPATDKVGHGTHVASTIAGSGAASGGRYRGVAPDADLYDGKVCEERGCQESALLAAMDWAANDIHANVVNLSLGGQDSPEIDPIEDAVNRLTEQTGTLFVIAAGNSGPGAHTVSSPGSAEKALTVGAVDRNDVMARFSSRGPRIGDGGVKPDITAPGVGIVAAKAAGSVIGDTVDERYMRLSGTSMATPHVAGAAALIAQQHPDWRADDLKAALMASAKPSKDTDVFSQGAGRVDLTKAIHQSIVAVPSSVSFPKAIWPHTDDTPVTRKVTYRNLGSDPVTLSLAATLRDSLGNAAPDGAVSLSASTVTIPANGSTSVDITSDTRHSGPDGAYGGTLVASGNGMSVTVPIAQEKEIESYTLTLKYLGLDGRPAAGSYSLYGLTVRALQGGEVAGGETRLRLPRGEYSLDGQQEIARSGSAVSDFHVFVQPTVKLTADTTVVFDARKTKGIDITVPERTARLGVAGIGYVRTGNYGIFGSSGFFSDLSTVHTQQLGPAASADKMVGDISTQWARPAKDGTFTDSPYLYTTLNPYPGGFPTGLRRRVRPGEFAVVDQQINGQPGQAAAVGVFGYASENSTSWAESIISPLPAKRRLFLDADGGTWSTLAVGLLELPNGDLQDTSLLGSARVRYRPGQLVRQRMNAVAVTPAPLFAGRLADMMQINTAMSDADGDLGTVRAETESSQLFLDGQLVAQFPYFGFVFADKLPAETRQYELKSTMTRPGYATSSTRIDMSWKFRSASTDDVSTLPYLGVRYRPSVDERNLARRTALTSLPLSIVAQQDVAVPHLRSMTLRVSGDGGISWRPATITRTGRTAYRAHFRTPHGASSVSLKLHVVDAQGNVTDITTADAYQLR